MSIFTTFLKGSSSIAEPIVAIGNVVDQLFTSDEERLTKKILLERLRQQPALAQAEINKVEAAHKSIFVSGWRPYIGWNLGFSFTYEFLARPIMNGLGCHFPAIDTKEIISLLVALLGMVTYRTVEKIVNKKKEK